MRPISVQQPIWQPIGTEDPSKTRFSLSPRFARGDRTRQALARHVPSAACGRQSLRHAQSCPRQGPCRRCLRRSEAGKGSMKSISIPDTLDDPQLFGRFLRKPETRAAWRGSDPWPALFALPMNCRASRIVSQVHRPQHIVAEPHPPSGLYARPMQTSVHGSPIVSDPLQCSIRTTATRSGPSALVRGAAKVTGNGGKVQRVPGHAEKSFSPSSRRAG
jgi:hypothetical protein